MGIAHRFFDYDEIYHAHVTWLMSAGNRPFIDFQAVHAPFLWYPLAALWRLSSDSAADRAEAMRLATLVPLDPRPMGEDMAPPATTFADLLR